MGKQAGIVSDFQSTPVVNAGVHSCSPVAPHKRVEFRLTGFCRSLLPESLEIQWKSICFPKKAQFNVENLLSVVAIRWRVEHSRSHDVIVGWNGLKVMLLDEYTSGTFGENVRPTPSVRGQFDGDVRRIERIDQRPARLHLTEIRFEWEIRLRTIASTRRSGASDNSSGRKRKGKIGYVA